jgi:epoxyqueuosine reductase
MLAEAYTPRRGPAGSARHARPATISVYARNRDYHDLVKKRLKRLGRWLIVAENGGRDQGLRRYRAGDGKAAGQAAGLGWQGKHTNLLSRDSATGVSSARSSPRWNCRPTTPEAEHCGSCRACLDICPTDAFPAPFQLDARRCISYLTIEHKGPVDPELRR